MARIASYNYYAVANDGAIARLDPQIRANPHIYPPDELLENAEIIFQISPAAEERYQAAWREYSDWVEAGAGQ
jgi:spermidine/putrescine-binding protein